jgi:hypothetical protein
MSEFDELMRAIKRYAEESGIADELDRLDEQYKNDREIIQKDLEQPCLIEAFFKRQAKLPPHLQQTSCMISCPCPRCSPRML